MNAPDSGGIAAIVTAILGAIGWAVIRFGKTGQRKERAERDMLSTLEHRLDDEHKGRLDAEQRSTEWAQKYTAEHEMRLLDKLRVRELESDMREMQSMLRKVERYLPAESPIKTLLQARQITDYAPLDELPPEKRK